MPTDIPWWAALLMALMTGFFKPAYDLIIGRREDNRKTDEQEHNQSIQDKDQMMRFAVEHINTLRGDLDKLRICLENKEKEYYQCREALAECKGKCHEQTSN